MTKEHLLKLTLAVYRVTDKFPENEPLKYFIRETAGRIFSFAASPHNGGKSKLESDLALLKDYFFIAKTQNWVSERNFLVLEKEYDKVKEVFYGSELKLRVRQSGDKDYDRYNNYKNYNSKNGRRRLSVSIPPPHERKQKIAGTIQQREKMTFVELLSSFPQISRRTLIRDLESLLKDETIKKQGNGKGVVYIPNGTKVSVPD